MDPTFVVLLELGIGISLEFFISIVPLFQYSATIIDTQCHLNSNRPLSRGTEVVLLQDEHGLYEVIKQDRYVTRPKTEDILALYLLTISNGWGRGCEMLIESGVKLDSNPLNRHGGNTLIHAAMYGVNLEILQMILARWTTADEAELASFGDPLFAFHRQALYYECPHFLKKREYILETIVEQRRRLQHLANVHLIPTGQYHCANDNGRLLDAHARCVIQGLARKGVNIPAYLKQERYSVYCYRGFRLQLSTASLDMLFDAGFRDIRAAVFECHGGLTTLSPLLYKVAHSFLRGHSSFDRFMNSVEWFLAKGADLRETWPGSSLTTLHLLGYGCGTEEKCKLYYRCYGLNLRQRAKRVVAVVSSGDSSDGCECPCSRSGCGFLHNFWKGLAREYHLDWTNLVKITVIYVVEFAKGSQSSAQAAVQNFIRFVLFSTLEIRHTCCDLYPIKLSGELGPLTPRYSKKELKCIVEEDADLRMVLEDLVPRFITQYENSGADLQDFVDDILEPGINKILAEMKTEDLRQYAVGRRELGVLMEEDKVIELSDSEGETEGYESNEHMCADSEDEEEY